MKISDVLPDLRRQQKAEHQPISEDDNSGQDVMIPPLQQKIELLKKAVNVDNHYDENSDETEEDESEKDKLNLTINVPKGQSDTKIELTINNMKKLAGISKAVIHNAADDNDILS